MKSQGWLPFVNLCVPYLFLQCCQGRERFVNQIENATVDKTHGCVSTIIDLYRSCALLQKYALPQLRSPFPYPPFSGPPRYELCIRPHSMANMHPFRALSFLLTGCSYPAIPVASHLGLLNKVSFLFGPQASPCIHFPHRVQSWLICTVWIT